MNNIIYVINGPNMNLLGKRKPEIYGNETLDQINEKIANKAQAYGLSCFFYQSNHEGDIIDIIHDAREKALGIIINPAAYTHYSYAIRDALEVVDIPVVEVHLSDVLNREDFRKNLITTQCATHMIHNKKSDGYLEALDYLYKHIKINT